MKVTSLSLVAAAAVVAAQEDRNGTWVGPTAHPISPLALHPSPTSYTTSTIYTTTVFTVTSCAPAVTFCPERGSVVTKTVSLYTTVCPVSSAVPHLPPPEPTPTSFGVSTVEKTIVSTVTSCPPAVPNCDIGREVTSVSTYTTTYPIGGPTAAHHNAGPQGTGALSPHHPMSPKGNVTLPSAPKVSTVSGATALASSTLLVFLGLAAGAATAWIQI
ncbi:BgtAcSP-30986 [Blumeria graminis f. sp. tritici]|uniref:BgtAcSP-30986 n=2 Tax=Blumeria graminis TaxID=34373 RepID=A0A9X9PQM8_BLUGR|nr:BgtAcSP-30986 [Blumeria graminis f. sp. tritici]